MGPSSHVPDPDERDQCARMIARKFLRLSNKSG
jgi:hypothetical protein